MLSVIIPARNEKYLKQTIQNVLDNAEGELEVIAILDGYEPDPPLDIDDRRLIVIRHPEAKGQRQSINEGVRIARGKYIMKLDAHCAVDKGFDVKLAADCEYDWTVVPRMYNLDVYNFIPKTHKKTDYMYIGWNDKNELRSLYYTGKDWLRWHREREHLLIDDTMGCMGPGWFMHKDRFWELGGCDENHGGSAGWGQQGIEVALKAWLSGGSLKVNKKTWFAHWFRGGDGGFPYPISGREVDTARKYSMNLWLNNKWEKQVRPLSWVLEKFNPPTWENHQEYMIKENAKFQNIDDSKRDELNGYFYEHHFSNTGKGPKTYWKGVEVLKMTTDLILFHEILWETRPDFIVEIGTKFGGSALFFQDMLDLCGGGQVITIDKTDIVKNKDLRIIYLTGNSTDPEIIQKVKDIVGDKKVMVTIDGNHHKSKVKWELRHYSPLVTSGQYLVLDDCYVRDGILYGPGMARDQFLTVTNEFYQTDADKKYLIGLCKGGWLRKK